MHGPSPLDTSRSPHARVHPVPIGAVTLDGGLWGERLRTLAQVSLPAQHESLQAAGVLDNFHRAAGSGRGEFRGLEFADTDLYKWVEAACWTLAGGPQPWLRARVDEAVALIERAQEPDGYLDTFHPGRPADRWTNLRSHHELYCVGHLLQAAVAHRRATGDLRLLGVARRAAELVCAVFGPATAGRRPGIDGHPGVEMALVELYRETGEARFLDQAAYFLDARGQGLVGGGRLGPAYYLDHRPLRALDQLTGHAVRALYAMCGATDLWLETGEPELFQVLERLRRRMVTRQMYVSGGLGSRPDTESFGDDLELPSARACSETCAAVASVMWAQRMLAATGDACHADLIEWTLLNALLAGWSLDGRAYAYENPLQRCGARPVRQPWFECACCPPNLARLVATVPALVYGVQGDAVLVNLYAGSTARLKVQGRTVVLRQRTRYPWDGEVELAVDAGGELALWLRIPAWCAGGVVLEVNGTAWPASTTPGSWAILRRTWSPGDRVSLRLPMPVRPVRSHPDLLENAGRAALTRGPLLYCLEEVDHPGIELRHVEVDAGRPFAAEWSEELLGGIAVVSGSAWERQPEPGWATRLYAPVEDGDASGRRPVSLRAVPYFAWANREPGAMQIWLGLS